MAAATAFATCLGVPLSAQAVKLQQEDIPALLSGNTAVGLWDGVPYRQYFNEDGTTIFAQEGTRSARGEWRVQGEEYQSIWPGHAEWESRFVMEYLGDTYRVSGSTPPTPFELRPGQQLIAE